LKTLLQRFQRSLTARLLLVFIFTGIVICAAIIITILHGFTSQWRGNVRPHLLQYLDYVNNDIGSPPDLLRARELAEELPINIYITGPNTDFSSTGSPLNIQNLDFFTPHRNRYRRKGEQTNPDLSSKIRFGEHDDRTILVNEVGDYQIAYELIHHSQRSARDNFIGRAMLLVLVLLGLCYFLIRRMLRPVQDIKTGVHRMGQGELSYRVPVRNKNDLGVLASSINAMAADIEHMLDAKQQLLLGVSHELRSPITRAKIATQLLDDSTNKQRLMEDLAEMETLITEILETERMQSGHTVLHRELVDPGKLAAAVLEELSLTVADNLPHYRLDEARLRLLLRNLYSNAQRHGGSADIPPSVSVAGDSASVTITVRDYGPGIPPEYIGRITEPFYRVDASRTRSTGGFGLGLYLCKKIADAHNGSLRVESMSGHGTSVIVTLAAHL